MINWTLALMGALSGHVKYVLNDAASEPEECQQVIAQSLDNLIFTLMKLSDAYALDGWRYVPGVALEAGGGD